MKTTPLERLIKADLILQEQQQSNRLLCKRANKLKHHAQALQKRLEDDILREALKFQLLVEKKDDNCFPIIEASLHYEVILRLMNTVLNDLEQMKKRQDKWKEQWKRVFKKENISIKMHELKTLLADDKLILSLKKSSIPPLCKTVSYWKNIHYWGNKEMMSTLTEQERIYGILEGMEHRMNTKATT